MITASQWLFFFSVICLFFLHKTLTQRVMSLPAESLLNRVFIKVPCSFTLSHSLIINPTDTKCSTNWSAITCNLKSNIKKKYSLKLCKFTTLQQDLLLRPSLVWSIFHSDFCIQDVHHRRVIVHVLYTCHFQRQRFSFCQVPDGINKTTRGQTKSSTLQKTFGV